MVGTRSKRYPLYCLFFFNCRRYIRRTQLTCIICISCEQSPITDVGRLSNILYNIVISLLCLTILPRIRPCNFMGTFIFLTPSSGKRLRFIFVLTADPRQVNTVGPRCWSTRSHLRRDYSSTPNVNNIIVIVIAIAAVPAAVSIFRFPGT